MPILKRSPTPTCCPIAFREKLKHAGKARGLKRQVMVTQSGCLDYCPASGCTVAIYPENTWSIVAMAEVDDLLDQILEGTTTSA